MRHLASLLVMGLPALAIAAPVDYRDDGSVRVGTEVFSSRAAFHHSDYFRANGLRCGSIEEEPTGVMELMSATDCGRSSTTINADYDDNRTLVIPVVFHVIKKTDGTGAISEALIKSQIDILNEDFNAIAGSPGAPGANAKIQFVLAKFDPAGNPTTGINVVTNNTYFNDPGSGGQNAMKRALKWDTTRYLNIYTNNAGGSGTLGYATFPSSSAGTQEDGVVLNWVYVGRNAPGGPPYDQGRTGTHEVGHYLGLYHTFQGGCGTTSAPFTSGDIIGDTAREAQPNYGCNPVASGCGGGMSPIENYMDYSGDACMTKFTAQQVNRIRCSMMNFRWVNTPPTAGFTYMANALDVTFIGTSTDAESPAGALRYNWTFGDGSTSTEQTPIHKFVQDGTYSVKLEVIDPGSGTSTTTQSVTVINAPAQPDAGVDPDDGNGGSDEAHVSAGCCDTRGGGSASMLFGLSTLAIVLRRRKKLS